MNSKPTPATDSVLDRLADIVCDLQFGRLPAEAIHAAKRSLIDALGCAYGAYQSEPATIARRMASTIVPSGASVIGTAHRTSPEMAAFANGVMFRYLDFNDSYVSAGGGGHPSDYDAAVLAAAEQGGLTGQDVIAGIVSAYELHGQLTDATKFGTDRWDYVTLGVIAAAGGAARAMNLPRERIKHAISIAIVGNIALLESRRGNLSMWKGCASANACRNGLFAALLAREGLTGPPRPFEGRNGFEAMVSGPLSSLDPPATDNLAILRCHFKRFPAGFFSQTAIDAALELRPRLLAMLDDIEEVVVSTFPFGLQAMASPEKWRPTTRETADHSLPYVVASALTHGELTMATFDREHLADPRTRALMDRLKVVVDPECERDFPDRTLNKLAVKVSDGTVYRAAVAQHRGHRANPMSDADIEAKFRSQAEDHIGPSRADQLLGAVWRLEEAHDLSSLMALTSVMGELR
ncbi:MAG: MmgE/PrpD family protein [Candidatus Dormibacteraceae bacterium]